jgi:hypothetical protein
MASFHFRSWAVVASELANENGIERMSSEMSETERWTAMRSLFAYDGSHALTLLLG